MQYAILATLAFIGISAIKENELIDHCFRDRYDFSQPLHPYFKQVFPFTFSILLFFFILTWIYFYLLKKNKAKLYYFIFWSYANYFFCIFLKTLRYDRNCHQTELNGVSGHFSFLTFQILTSKLILKLFEKEKKIQQKLKWLRYIFYLFILLVCMSSAITYFGGYHSIRQSLLGILFAVISNSILETLFARQKQVNLKPITKELHLILFSYFFGALILALQFNIDILSKKEIYFLSFILFCYIWESTRNQNQSQIQNRNRNQNQKIKNKKTN
eukprot:TRINITY_DN920_c1_g1_i1.p1 TRINITY_DN920_c1_g1~~TRINITY_DN920_c1_g1_i1.p1  ORF type:complete len:272 (-),score=52.95 TRINITY_DN920_c1_g1_i1:106-921(-)